LPAITFPSRNSTRSLRPTVAPSIEDQERRDVAQRGAQPIKGRGLARFECVAIEADDLAKSHEQIRRSLDTDPRSPSTTTDPRRPPFPDG
jgi:hypothetical protein